jgi:hypothetical protein
MKKGVVSKLTGCLIKFIYAALYQEDLIPSVISKSPLGIQIGALLFPYIN